MYATIHVTITQVFTSVVLCVLLTHLSFV